MYEAIDPFFAGLKDDTFAFYMITNFAEDYSDLIYLNFNLYAESHGGRKFKKSPTGTNRHDRMARTLDLNF